MTIKALKEKRGELAGVIRKLADLVNKENRDFTGEEQENWEKANDDYNLVARQLEVAERQEQLTADEGGDRGIGREDIDAQNADGGGDAGGGNGAVDRGAGPELWANARDGSIVPAFTRASGSIRAWFARRGAREGQPAEQLGLGRCVRAWLTGARNEAEERALAEGTDAAGGFTVPSLVSAEFMDRLRENATVLQAGARVFPFSGTDSLTIARLDTAPTLTWAAEAADTAAESAMNIAGTVFTPKTVRVIVLASREVWEDSVNIEQLLKQTLIREFAAELDKVALVGSGSGAEPTGLRLLSGVTELDISAVLTAADPYNEIVDLWEDLAGANAPDISFSGGGTCILHPREMTTIQTGITSGVRIAKPSLFANVRFLVSQKISITDTPGTESSLFLASTAGWANLLIGMRMPLTLRLLQERYATTNQIGILASMRMDVAAGNAAALARLIGIQP